MIKDLIYLSIIFMLIGVIAAFIDGTQLHTRYADYFPEKTYHDVIKEANAQKYFNISVNKK